MRRVAPLIAFLAALPLQAQSGGSPTIENRAVVRYIDGNGEAGSAEASAIIELGEPVMALELTVLNGGTVHVGDTLIYRLRLYNRSSAAPLRQVLVTDSLPVELQYSNALPLPGQVTPPASSTGAGGGSGGVASWYFDTIEPNGMREILLHTTVVSAGTGELVNTANARSTGMSQAVAAVAVVTVEPERDRVAVAMRASSLEAALGDVVAFTITLDGNLRAAAGELLIRSRLPDGMKIQPSSVRGGTLTQHGRELTFALPAQMPGAVARVSYAVSIASARVASLRSSAWVEARGVVISDSANAIVRVRDAALMTRAVLGKVWQDENGDGRQQANEQGVEHALIWSSHGETVRVDAEGRFSFPDMKPGRYTLRIDPLSVPAGYLPAAAVTVRVDGWSTPAVSFALRRGATQVSDAAAVARGVTLSNGVVNAAARITAPADGTVFGTNRAFVRVAGEAAAAVELYDGERLLAQSVLRPDGSEDFVGIELTPGAHTLETRVRAVGGEQRHAVKVHVSGAPRHVVRMDSASIRAGRPTVLALRVLDEWNVAVAQQPFATVAGENLHVLDDDASASSVGLQLPVTADGMLLVPVRGDSTGTAKLTVGFGAESVEVLLTLLPEIRPLIVTADGEIGIGAAPQNYGSIVARGALDAHTAVTLSYDSRR